MPARDMNVCLCYLLSLERTPSLPKYKEANQITEQVASSDNMYNLRFPVQISIGTSTILSQIFRSFPQSLKAMSGQYFEIHHETFLPQINYPVIQHFVI
jgi:hypothetical protein